MRISFLRYDMQGAPSRHKVKLVPAREGLAPSKRYSTVELIVIGANVGAKHTRSPNRGALLGNLPVHQRRAAEARTDRKMLAWIDLTSHAVSPIAHLM